MKALFDILHEACRNLARWPVRAALPALGVMVGTGALIAITSTDLAWERSIRDTYAKKGLDLIHIQVPAGARLSRHTLNVEDALYLQQNCPSLGEVAWSTISMPTVSVVRGRHGRALTEGISPNYLASEKWSVASGRGFEAADFANHRQVCLISPLAAKLLFDNADPLGQEIRINGYDFTVVGKLRLPEMIDQAREGCLLLPYTTYDKVLQAGSLTITATAAQLNELRRAHDEIDSALSERLGAREEVSFCHSDWLRLQGVLQARKKVRFFLAASAGLLLLVAGIGIAIVLFMNVMERSAEFGVKRSFGAFASRLYAEIIAEGISIALLGGIAGIFLGIWLTRLAAGFFFGGVSEEALITKDHFMREAVRLSEGAVVDAPLGIIVWAVAAILAVGLVASLLAASGLGKASPIVLLGAKKHSRSRFFIPLIITQGVLSICLMLLLVGMYQGLAAEELRQVRSLMGTQYMSVYALFKRNGLPVESPSTLQSMTALCADASALEELIRDIPEISRISASLQLQSISSSYHGNKTKYNCAFAVSGDIFATGRHTASIVLAGRKPIPEEIANGSKVCLIDHRVAGELFGDADPVGKNLKLEGYSFEIVGVLQDTREGIGFILFPAKAAPRHWLEEYAMPVIDLLLRDEKDYLSSKNRLDAALRERLKMDSDLEISYYIPAEMAADVLAKIDKASYRSTLVGFLAMLVAGLGVFNMLLVSVQEDIREIGLRRALGATKLRVSRAYLFRGAMLAFISAILGALASILLLKALAALSGLPAAAPLHWILYATGMLVTISTAAALLPAIIASRVHPSTALKYE